MTLDLALNMFGTFCFAISGSLLAARRGFDVVGSVLLGSLTGLGGGVVRDLILGVPPTAFSQPLYFLAPLAAAVLVYFLFSGIERFPRTLLVFDAAGLGLFCTTGTAKALALGMNPVASVLLGVATGVGGGLLRDVVANRDPDLFNPKDIYAMPALIGASLVAIVWSIGWYCLFSALAIAAIVFALRVLSLHLHWQVPRAMGGWHTPPVDDV